MDLTIDLWDTLLRRNVAPDEIKLASCRRVAEWLHRQTGVAADAYALLELRREVERDIGSGWRARGFDDEYELSEVMTALLRAAVGLYAPGTGGNEPESETVRGLCEAEVADEHREASLDPRISGVIERVGARRVIVVSDFYMGGAVLAKLLAEKAPGLRFTAVVSSCDVRLNKRSGRLFAHVGATYGLEPGRWLHVGDNPQADVAAATRAGVAAEQYLPGDLHRAREEREEGFRRATREALGAMPGPMSRAKGVGEAGEAVAGMDRSAWDVPYALGRAMSPAFFALGRWLAVKIGARGVNGRPVLFFTREGLFFRRLARACTGVADAGTGDGKLPLERAKLAMVSRMATFAASIGEPSVTDMMRLWAQYSEMSMRTMLVSLQEDPREYAALLKSFDLPLDERVRHPWLDERVKALFADAMFKEKLMRGVRGRRELLKAHLAECGLVPKGSGGKVSRAVVVDVGWRGTIQDNLARVYPEVEFHGLYVGLFRYLAEQPGNVEKEGFLFDLNRPNGGMEGELKGAWRRALDGREPLQPVSPIEMLCNSPQGSLRGFRRAGGVGNVGGGEGGTEGKVEPVFQAVEGETRAYADFVGGFQAGVLAGCAAALAGYGGRVPPVEELRRRTREMWMELICNPPEPIARTYFRLTHNETFGTAEVFAPSVAAGGLGENGAVSGAALSAAAVKTLLARAEASRWPQAYLKLVAPALIPVHDRLRSTGEESEGGRIQKVADLMISAAD